MKNYRVQYTMDGQTWYTWQESTSLHARLFPSLWHAWSTLVRDPTVISLPIPARDLVGIRMVLDETEP